MEVRIFAGALLTLTLLGTTLAAQQRDSFTADDSEVQAGVSASQFEVSESFGDDVSVAIADCYCCEPWRLFPQSFHGFNIYGWLNAGYVINPEDPSSKFNGPYNAVDRANEPMLNQAYLVAEKKLDEGYTSIGGRFDVLYGEDFHLAQSFGLENRDDGTPHWNPEYYGLAIPQAYVEVGHSALSLKVGKFYSIVGYEGLPAVNNFFYTKSYSYQFAGPFTHCGALATWTPSCCWELQAGVTNCWDAFDIEPDDHANLLAKVKYTDCCDGWWTSFAICTGDNFNNLGGLPIANEFTNRTRYSWLVSVPVNCNLEYVFHHWLGAQEDGAVGGGTAYWYGIDQYLTYNVNDCWKAGMRFEWFRDQDGTRVGLNRTSNPNNVPFEGNFFSVTAGLNWMPTCNLTVRPELRFDWFNGDQARQPYDDGADDSQFLLAVDAILQF